MVNNMSDKIDIRTNNLPGLFVIQAIVQGKKLNDVIASRKEGELLDIQLIINGVEVPFISTLENLWERANDDINNRAMDMAIKMVTAAKLDGVVNALNELEYKMIDALHKVKL